MPRTVNIIHPGEILLEEFMIPMGISQNRLATELRIPVPRVHDIVHGRRGISADTAIRLGRYFETGPEFWSNLQSNYDLSMAQQELEGEISRIVPFREACLA